MKVAFFSRSLCCQYCQFLVLHHKTLPILVGLTLLHNSSGSSKLHSDFSNTLYKHKADTEDFLP
jgi:hypothetical protein